MNIRRTSAPGRRRRRPHARRADAGRALGSVDRVAAESLAADAIVVEGNRRGRSRNRALLFSCRARRTVRRSRARCGAEGAGRNRPVRQGHDRARRRAAGRACHRGAGARPRRLRRQQEDQGRRSCRRDRVQAARHAAARRRCRRTSAVSSKPTGMPGATRSASCPRSSTAATAASISSMRSPRARRRTVRQIDFTGNHGFGERAAQRRDQDVGHQRC